MFNTCALRIQKILLSWFSALSFVLLIRADIIKWPLQLEQVFGVDYCIAIPKDIVGICSCFYTHTRKDKTVACYVLLYHVLNSTAIAMIIQSFNSAPSKTTALEPLADSGAFGF